jgi:hypothetical protein
MHYYDNEHIEENTLTLVIYIHDVCVIKKGVINDMRETDIVVSSIHECKYFPPHLLYRILNKPNKFFKKIPEINFLDSEEYYEVVLKAVDWGKKGKGKVSVKSIENVTWHENQFYQLH